MINSRQRGDKPNIKKESEEKTVKANNKGCKAAAADISFCATIRMCKIHQPCNQHGS